MNKMPHPAQEYLFEFLYEDGSNGVFYRISKQSLVVQKRWFKRNFPNRKLIQVQVDWIGPLIKELKALKGKPWEALVAKCYEEQRLLSSILYEYGDPRKW